MGAIPSVTEVVRDFGLGVSQLAAMRCVVVGVTGGGTANTLAWYSNQPALRATHVEGPAVEMACNILAKGGGPVGILKVSPSVAASNGSVTQSGGGPLVSVAGTAAIDAHVRVEIMLGGALGTARFRYCVDGYTSSTVQGGANDTESERTYSETLTVPSGGSFAIPNLGITLTFAAGTYVLAEVYQVDVECAGWNATDLGNAFAGLSGLSDAWRFAACATSKACGDETAHATLVAALQTQLAALESSSKYRRGMIPADAGESTAAQVKTALENTTAIRCLVPFGMVRRTTTKPFAGYGYPVTHSVDVFAARAAKVLPSTDLKRVKSGPLDELVKVFHDEYLSASTLDDIKVSTLRTFEYQDGYFITQGRLKSPDASDFKLWPLGIVMDIACETAHQAMELWIGAGVRTATNVIEGVSYSGAIDDRDATIIEEAVSTALVAQLVTPKNAEGTEGHVSDMRFSLDRTVNILSTGVIKGTVGIKPLGYIDFITIDLGFVTELPAAAAA